MQFIEPKKRNVKHEKYSWHYNKAINLKRVMSISKTRTKHHPDIEEIPSLVFWFSENMSEYWYYDTEKEREVEYKKIMAV
jgi:hypothetical protein